MSEFRPVTTLADLATLDENEVIAELRGLLSVTSPTALATGAVRHDHATYIMRVLPRLLDLAERAATFNAWFAENQKHLDALGDLLGTCEGINPLPFAVKRLRAALEPAP